MKKIVLLSFALIFAYTTFSQSAGLPVITTPNRKNDRPIELKELKIYVFVADNIASTTVEMLFFNPNNRIMEGELNFPLANRVTVSRFALDVNGEMREGVVVEKEKATQTFEAVTRRQVDPGLVEVTKGNNFKARVYPIPAQGTKKALIAFEEELGGDAKNYIYQLPLNIKRQLKEFSVKVEVVMNKPEVVQSNHPTINLSFTEERNSYISECHQSDVSLDSQIAFSIPKPKEIKNVITYKGKVTSDNYFHINLNVKKEARAKLKPEKIAVVWDESSSAKNRDLEKELKTLTDYLKWVNTGTVQLFTFANTLNKEQTFNVNNGACAELIATLRKMQYDGGTNIGAVDFATIEADEILLFTDGISNFGIKEKLIFKAPVFIINSANISDHNRLESIALSSNGGYINGLELSLDEMLERLTHQQKQFIKASFNPEKIKELYPMAGTKITDHFSCSGIIEGAKANLTLYFGYGNEITESRTITVDNLQGIDNHLGERIWAQKKLHQLLIENDEKAVKSHGKKFNLVTPGTSLIVLDNVEDYVRYEIAPPKSLLAEYNKLAEAKRQTAITHKQNRIEQICEQFKADVKWWENAKDYRKIKITEKQADKDVPPPPPAEVAISDLEIEDDAEMMEISVDISGRDTRSEVKEASPAPSKASIQIKAWDSNATYINELKRVDKQDVYSKYLELKPMYEDLPSFYFDVATYMFQKSLMKEGLRVISNLAELELENVEILRTLGRKLAEFGFDDEALNVFKEVERARSFEPHTYIDLGLAYADKKEYQKAIATLYTVIDKNWDIDIINRFRGIELIVLHEINNIIYHHGKGLDTSFINPCFIKQMPLDMRIVIDWDANDTDIDLWITDPRKEKCSYQNKETRIGGMISNDITGGYGPEEFRLKYAIDGNYIIEANFYGTSKQSLMGKVTVRAFVYTKFGTNKEEKKVLTLQLEPTKEGEYTVGEIQFVK